MQPRRSGACQSPTYDVIHALGAGRFVRTSKGELVTTTQTERAGRAFERRVTGIAIAITTLALLQAGCGSDSITVVSWGGSYAEACQRALFDPFTAETGLGIQVESHNGGLSQVRAQVETGNVYWDVVDLDYSDVVLGCDEGLFERIDIDALPPAADGTPASEDFEEGTLSECGGGGLYFSGVFAYNRATYPTDAPSRIEDLFDLEKYPGRRGLRRAPTVNLEMALMADGVPPEEVFAVLSTPEGVDRAFRKLDTVKDQIVWWEAGAQPPQMLADREVVMSTAYNGRIFNAQVVENQPFTIVWDGQVLDYGQFAIVAGTPRLEAAMAFLTYSSRPESMAEISKYIAYSPTRRSAIGLVGTHLDTGVDMRPHMPSAEENMTRALRNDPEWWTNHGEEMNERFSAWLLQ